MRSRHVEFAALRAADHVPHSLSERVRELGLPKQILHDLRRTVARNMECAGVPRLTAREVYRAYTGTMSILYAIGVEKDVE